MGSERNKTWARAQRAFAVPLGLLPACLGSTPVDLTASVQGESAIAWVSFGDEVKLIAFEPDHPESIPEWFFAGELRAEIFDFDLKLRQLGLAPGFIESRGGCPLPLAPRARRWEGAWETIDPKASELSRVEIAPTFGDCCPLDPACAGCKPYDVQAFPIESGKNPNMGVKIDENRALFSFQDSIVVADASGVVGNYPDVPWWGSGFRRGDALFVAREGELRSFDVAEVSRRVGLGEFPLQDGQLITTSEGMGSIVGPTDVETPFEIFAKQDYDDEESGEEYSQWRHFDGETWRFLGEHRDFRSDFRTVYEGPDHAMSFDERGLTDSVRRDSRTRTSTVAVHWSGARLGYLFDIQPIEGVGILGFGGAVGLEATILKFDPALESFDPIFTQERFTSSISGRIRGNSSLIWFLLRGQMNAWVPGNPRICPSIELPVAFEPSFFVDFGTHFLLAGGRINDENSMIVVVKPIPE